MHKFIPYSLFLKKQRLKIGSSEGKDDISLIFKVVDDTIIVSII